MPALWTKPWPDFLATAVNQGHQDGFQVVPHVILSIVLLDNVSDTFDFVAIHFWLFTKDTWLRSQLPYLMKPYSIFSFMFQKEEFALNVATHYYKYFSQMLVTKTLHVYTDDAASSHSFAVSF